MKLKFLMIFISFLILNSCGNPNNSTLDNKEKLRLDSIAKREKTLENLIQKYKANPLFFESKSNTSFEFQSNLDKKNIVVLELANFEIFDVKKNGPNFKVTIIDFIQNFEVEFDCSIQEMETLFPNYLAFEFETNGFLVFKINYLDKIKYKIGQNDELTLSDRVLIKGDLINVIRE